MKIFVISTLLIAATFGILRAAGSALPAAVYTMPHGPESTGHMAEPDEGLPTVDMAAVIPAMRGDAISYEEQPDRAGTAPDRAGELENIERSICSYPTLNEWQPYDTPYERFYITGNFFGDRGDDTAVLLYHEDTRHVKLCILNKGSHGAVFVTLDDGHDDHEPGGMDYSWVGKFRMVPAGEVLWSNYEDDFRSFEEVPDEQKVYLGYDAIYVHAYVACGGGFIFWRDGKFNWLQQE